MKATNAARMFTLDTTTGVIKEQHLQDAFVPPDSGKSYGIDYLNVEQIFNGPASSMSIEFLTAAQNVQISVNEHKEVFRINDGDIIEDEEIRHLHFQRITSGGKMNFRLNAFVKRRGKRGP